MTSNISTQPEQSRSNENSLLKEANEDKPNRASGTAQDNKSVRNHVTAFTNHLRTQAGNFKFGERIMTLFTKEKYLFCMFLLAILFLLIGCIPLMIPVPISLKMEHSFDYTNCEKLLPDTTSDQTCREYVQATNNTDCQCIAKFTIPSLLRGDVTIYFDLPTLDQTLYIGSRDNDQLRGVLSNTPSKNCEPYRYNNGTPIAPCGALADFMFTDRIVNLILVGNDEPFQINIRRDGMLSAEDKVGFRNPEDLMNALIDFSKPKSWNKPIYQLDESNPENNGFQNEPFISWMRTDWKRKHVGRICRCELKLQNGLPAGNYQITIQYAYPLYKYSGQRKLIFVAEQENTEYAKAVIQQYIVSVVLLSTELIILAIVAVGIKKYTDKRNRDDYGKVIQTDQDHPPVEH